MKRKIKTVIIELVAGAVIGAVCFAMMLDGAQMELNRLDTVNRARAAEMED